MFRLNPVTAVAPFVALAACHFSAATKIIGADSAPAVDSGVATTDSADTDTDADSSAPVDSGSDTASALPANIDDDGDGYTENQGDCNDADPAVHPDITDGCDGVDTDCDGVTDEDAPDDAYEPNDTTPYNLGSLEDDPTKSLTANLKNDDDVDRYQFTIVDSVFDFFAVKINVSDIPADATYIITLNRLRSDADTPLGQVQQIFATGTGAIEYDDTSNYEDGGDYEIVIQAAAGASCEHDYLLAVSQ